MITSKFNKNLNILETEFKDDVAAEDILIYIEEFETNTAYPRKLKTLIIAEHAVLRFSTKALKPFNKAKNQSLKQYEMVISAIVINNSVNAAMATMYSLIANNKKYKNKVFSTQQAALLWLESFSF